MGMRKKDCDPRFAEAVEVFLAVNRASASLLQRRMAVGYTRAAKICDEIETAGIIGPVRGMAGVRCWLN